MKDIILISNINFIPPIFPTIWVEKKSFMREILVGKMIFYIFPPLLLFSPPIFCWVGKFSPIKTYIFMAGKKQFYEGNFIPPTSFFHQISHLSFPTTFLPGGKKKLLKKKHCFCLIVSGHYSQDLWDYREKCCQERERELRNEYALLSY